MVVSSGIYFLESAGFALEDGVGRGFRVEEEGCEHEEGVEDGEGPEEPPPADPLCYETADYWAKGWAEKGYESCDSKGLSSFMCSPAVS